MGDVGGDLFHLELIFRLRGAEVGFDWRDRFSVGVHRDDEKDDSDEDHGQQGDDEAGDGGGAALGIEAGFGFGCDLGV